MGEGVFSLESQLRQVAQSYDRAIEEGRRGGGADPYRNLPASITGDPDYPFYLKALEEEKTAAYSGPEEIRAYLSPRPGMKFADLGCCVNLIIRGYDQWPSTYYGVDISARTIELLREYAAERRLAVGSLHCGSIHETPYETDFFDIAACIGVLEYFPRDFAEKAVREAWRILKSGGRMVLDIPNTASPACRVMMRIEEVLGRPDRFDLTPPEFEELLRGYFEIEKAEKAGDWAMFQYFLRRGK